MIQGTKVAMQAVHDSELIIKPLNYLKYKIFEAPKLLFIFSTTNENFLCFHKKYELVNSDGYHKQKSWCFIKNETIFMDICIMG